MTPDQFTQFLEANEKATGAAVEKYVNGHMRDMKKDLSDHIVKHDAFMADVKPILQAYQGVGTVGTLVKWLAGVAVAALAIKGIFFK